MKKLSMLVTLLALSLVNAGVVQAYENEVWEARGQYHWKVANVQQGSSADLATAMQGGIGSGNREVHILTGGDLSKTVYLEPGLTLRGHGNTLTRSHGGYGFHREGSGDIAMYDLNLDGHGNMWIRTSRASNLTFDNISITKGSIGIRVDSHPSRPYEEGRWVHNLTVRNCRFENLGSHGLETYGVDGVYVDGIVARNNGESGVLFNKSRNGFVGTVDAYRCSFGGGYAGLRFANDCSDFTVQYLRAIECGRGFFTVTGATNIVVEEVYIRDSTSHAILIQHSDGVGIKGGSYNGHALNHYTSVNSWIHATNAVVAAGAGQRLIVNAASGRVMNAAGNSNGANVDIRDYSGLAAQRWNIAETGAAFTIRGAQSGSRSLDVWNWGTDDGTNIALYDFWDGDPQRFVIEPVDSGYRITPVISSAQSLEASGTANAANVRTWSYTGAEQQEWYIVPSVESAPGASGLVAHLEFDETRGLQAANSSGDNWQATLHNEPAWGPGVLNNALRFSSSASQHATLPAGLVSGLDDFTISAWIRVASSSPGARVFDFGTGADTYMFFAPQYDEESTGMRFAIRTPSVDEQVIDSSVPLPLDNWVHVAVTREGIIGRIYVNGTLAGSNANLTLSPSSLGHTTLNFLGKSRSSGSGFNGSIDDFRIYNRALNEAELDDLVSPAPPPTVAAAPGDGEVILTWEVGNAATSYDVKRAARSGGPFTTIAHHVTATSFTDTGLTNGVTYYYVVAGNNSRGQSEDSAEVSVSPTDQRIHLTFDETSGTLAADSSGRGQDAEVMNGATWGSGRIGNAVQLRAGSSQYVDLPAGNVDDLTDFTIMTWVRLGSASQWSRIFDFGGATTPTANEGSYMFLTPSTGSVVRFAITTSGYGNAQQISGSAPLPVGVWTHVAVTLSGSTGRLYVNGNQVGMNNSMTLNPASLGDLTRAYIGRSMFAADPHLNGSVDDFRIYTRAISASEIALFATPLTPPELTATARPAAIELSWSEVSGASSYTLNYATTSGGPYAVLASDLAVTEFLHEDLNPDTTYFYVASAANVTGAGPESDEVSEVPEAPLNPNGDRLPVVFALDWDEGEGPTATLTLIESAAGHAYQLQTTTDLGAGEWVDVGEPLAGTGNLLSVTIPVDGSASRLFYRFVLESDH